MAQDVHRSLKSALAEPAGIVSLPDYSDAETEGLLEWINSQGYQSVLVDVEPVKNKSSLLAALYAALQLPSWFGFNYDALQDAFEMIEPMQGRPWVLVFRDFEALERNDPDCARIFLDIFIQAANMEGSALFKLIRL